MVTIHISNFGQNVFLVEKHLETKGVGPEVPPTKTVCLGLARNLFVMDLWVVSC